MLACLSADETGKTTATLAAMLEPLPLSSDNRAQDGGEGERRSKFPLGLDDPRLRASNRHGHTALHCAAFASCPTAVRMLLEAGADCTVGDKAGRTAYDVALNLAGKKTPVREAGRGGGSTPAAECLDLLRNRRETHVSIRPFLSVCVRTFQLHITAQSGPVILAILCHLYLSDHGGINDKSMYVCMVITYSKVWINRVRLPILLVVS